MQIETQSTATEVASDDNTKSSLTGAQSCAPVFCEKLTFLGFYSNMERQKNKGGSNNGPQI